jgi:hypothetical protein
MVLSDDDKRRIEEEERFRAEVRRKEGATKGSGCGSGCLLVVLVFFVLFICVLSIGQLGGNSSEPPTPIPTSASSSGQGSNTDDHSQVLPSPQSTALMSVPPKVAEVGAEKAPAPEWNYQEEADRMSGGLIKLALVQSSNTVEFGFPYGGAQHARLELRIHPRYGRDVIFAIEKGQFTCDVGGCRVSLRFDNNKAKIFQASEPSDHSTTSLFVHGYQSIVNELKKAKHLYIEALFYQQGLVVFQFDVAGLEWKDVVPQRRNK